MELTTYDGELQARSISEQHLEYIKLTCGDSNHVCDLGLVYDTTLLDVS